MINKRKIIDWIIGSIFSLILFNLGSTLIIKMPEEKYLGIITMVISFVLLYFSYYIFQIRDNGKKVIELKEKLNELQTINKLNKEILNSLTTIKLLDNTTKLLKIKK